LIWRRRTINKIKKRKKKEKKRGKGTELLLLLHHSRALTLSSAISLPNLNVYLVETKAPRASSVASFRQKTLDSFRKNLNLTKFGFRGPYSHLFISNQMQEIEPK
jgi:hypothetical protein